MPFSIRCMASLVLVVSGSEPASAHFDASVIGRHCCLWCEISSDSLKEPRAQRDALKFPHRSLERIKADHRRYIADGGDIKKAKFFNNVINENFFDIDLEQVHNSV